MRAMILGLTLLGGSTLAGEGMWVPQQLPEIAEALGERGLELDAAQLAELTGDPLGAIVSIGGCTAGFVSAQGLVITNHHCAYGAIQLNASAERDLLSEGFVATELSEELPAGPNARVFVIDQIRDVTSDMLSGITDRVRGAERHQRIEAARKALVAGCETGGDTRCTVYSFFGGLQYRLFRQLEIRDVRLVYAPPGSIGKYGGDIDNWMWPRHTGDFAFYRAYVGPDGRPAAPSPDNVPYQPAQHLRVAAEGLSPGEFAMVAGYPGRTFRYALAEEFRQTVDWTYPVRGAVFAEMIELIEGLTADDRESAIRYAGSMASWNNARKNFQGQLEGFERIDALTLKHNEEQAVLDWLRQQGRSGRSALQAHQALTQIIATRSAARERDLVLGGLSGTAMLGSASTLVRLAHEQAKPDAEREPGYMERDLPRVRGSLESLDRRHVAAIDRELLLYHLRRHASLPAELRIVALDEWLGSEQESQWLARLDQAYADTRLGDQSFRLSLFDGGKDALDGSDEPFVKLAAAMLPELLAIEAQRRELDGEDLRQRPVYLQAVIDYNRTQGRAVYPDANGSLRITFGNVVGYSPRDAVSYEPFTSLEGILEKDTGEDPFDSPALQLKLIREQQYRSRDTPWLGSVPVNFLTDMDVTGGNSGSPTLNARGELVGLVFDGNWESVSSAWVFNPALTRTIHVDIRYMLWVMENVFPAPALLQEMGVTPVSTAD